MSAYIFPLPEYRHHKSAPDQVACFYETLSFTLKKGKILRSGVNLAGLMSYWRPALPFQLARPSGNTMALTCSQVSDEYFGNIAKLIPEKSPEMLTDQVAVTSGEIKGIIGKFTSAF